MAESEKYINIRDATALKYLRLGETLAQWTQFEPVDNQTQENLQLLQEHLHHKPALILGSHTSPVDVLHTALFLTHNLKFENAIAATASGDYFFPPLHILYSAITNLPGAHIYPIQRFSREENKSHLSLKDTISKLSHGLFYRKEPINQKFPYIRKARQALKESWPNTLVFSATHAGNGPDAPAHRGNIYLLRKIGYPAYCVASYYNPPDNQYYTFLSKPLPIFHSNSTNSEEIKKLDIEINEKISQTHLDLEKHAFQKIPTLTAQSIPIKKYLSSLFKNSFSKTPDPA